MPYKPTKKYRQYNIIGAIAQALSEYDVPISLSTLSKLLHNKGALPYHAGFDIGSIVAAAYAYWVLHDLRTANAIASVFRSEDGKPIIPVNEPPALLHESQEA